MLLEPGSPTLRQTTPTTCGSACLVMARAVADPAFATWLTDGAGARGLVDGADLPERFARYEAVVKARTAAARGLAGPQVPWPWFFGTAPWAALREVAAIAGVSPREYRMVLVRRLSPEAREQALRDVAAAVSPGRSALLYVGSPKLPRHVVLVARPDAAREVMLYEPSAGEVRVFDPAALASGQVRLGGWPVTWLAIRPRRVGPR